MPTKRDDYWNTAVVYAILLANVFLLSIWLCQILFLRDNALGWPPCPSRLFLGIVFPIFIAIWGLNKRNLSASGAAAGLLVGFPIAISNYGFLSALLVFFVTGSKATTYRSDLKNFEAEFKQGGQRNWIQVLCNGGIASAVSFLYIIEVGCGERSVDFSRNYFSSMLALGVLGSLSCCCGDTLASELGPVFAKGKPRLITSWKTVPKGTNGAISGHGLIFSAIGGFIVGLAYEVTVSASLLDLTAFQSRNLIVCTTAGLLGSAVDSLMGASLQFSGEDTKTGKIVEFHDPGVRKISGCELLNNHSVNLLSSLLTALVTPFLGYLLL